MSDDQQRRDESPPKQQWPEGSYPFTLPAEKPHSPDDEETVIDPRPPFTTPPPAGGEATPDPEPGSPEWYAAKAQEQRAFDEGRAAQAPPAAEPRTDAWQPVERPAYDGPAAVSPVTAIPGPQDVRPGAYGVGAPPVKQPMGAPTPVPPRIGRPTMPYGYTGQLAPAQPVGGYQLMLPYLKPIHSGPSVGSVLAGSAGILAGIAVGCVGFAFETVFAVAFTVLAVFLSGTALALAFVGLRQVRGSGGEYAGRGTAITGMVLGGVGLFVTVVMILVVAASAIDGGGSGTETPPTNHGVTHSPTRR